MLSSAAFNNNEYCASSSSRHIIKQGYLFKRGGSGILTHWKLKFIVLASNATKDGTMSTTLFVNDTRDQLNAPKHQVNVDTAKVDVKTNNPSKYSGLASASLSNFFSGGRRGTPRYPFSVNNAEKKFLFSAQTKSDLEDWIQVLTSISSNDNPVIPPPRSAFTKYSTLKTLREQSQSSNAWKQNFNTDDDAMSTYSDDSCITEAHERKPISRPNSALDFDEISDWDTMSFFSEPVLTSHELHMMGNKEASTFNSRETLLLSKPDFGRIDTNYQRKPLGNYKTEQPKEVSKNLPSVTSNWNGFYQKAIHSKAAEDLMELKREISMIEIIGLFQEHSSFQVQKIIDELHLNDNSRDRYHREDEEDDAWTFQKNDGIIYQFMLNYDETNTKEIQETKIRTSHELHGINAVVSTPSSNLHIPLMCIVDYKGFRVIAQADMSDNGPILIHELTSDTHPKYDETANQRIAEIGKYLNLKAHSVMMKDDRRVVVPTAAGVEAYLDNETDFMYVGRLHEIFPLDVCPPLENNSSSRSSITSSSHPSVFSSSLASPSRRMRPEFIKFYPHPLCSDALTTWCSWAKRDKETNDGEVLRASRFLRETWIPGFVRKLDELEIRPVDSRNLALELHRAGINIRYLGLIAKISKIPHIREICFIEMVSRSTKNLLQTKLRTAILNFRSVRATSIEEQLREYAVNIFNLVLGYGEKSEKFWRDKLVKEIYRKFEYEMEYDVFFALHKQALFMSMQHQCGITFQDTITYRFTSKTSTTTNHTEQPLSKAQLISFTPKTKHLGTATSFQSSTQLENNSTFLSKVKLPADELLAYHLSRHFKSLGKQGKLDKNEVSAQSLAEVASHYNSTGRHEEAKAYALSACAAARNDSCFQAFALSQLLETTSGLQINSAALPENEIYNNYNKACGIIAYLYGELHPYIMGLHDRMCAIYVKCKRFDKALEFHEKSLDIAFKCLGKHHSITAGYLVKAGILFNHLHRTEEAIKHLQDAIHLYQSLSSPSQLLAEVHFHLSTSLSARGDNDSAIAHSQKCVKIREKVFGVYDIRTVEVYMQLSKLLLNTNASGVMTTKLKNHYGEAISCLEKVFRFLKMHKKNKDAIALTSSGIGGSSTPIQRHGRSKSLIQQEKQTHFHGKGFPGGFLLGGGGIAAPISGPFFSPPFTATLELSKNRLHHLTKQIVKLKLELLEKPIHRECIRTLRAKISQNSSFSADDARQVILRLAAVSPSIYMDGIFARIEEGDDTAVEELGIVLQLTEKDTLGLNA